MNDPLQRLLAKVEKSENGCWEFTGYVNYRGYGKFRHQGKSWYAHRISYILQVGEVPVGMDLDHICRNRKCINPAHLEPVSRSVNCKRGRCGERAAEIERSKTHCPHGHEYTPENTRVQRKTNGSYGRLCKTCTRARNRRWWAANGKAYDQKRRPGKGKVI